MENMKPIQIVSTSMQVAHVLRNAILTRELREGEVINLDMISKQLGVSNTPVREALRILANDGLVRLRPNKGAIVLGVTPQSVRDYYEVRAMLEACAVRKICRAEDLTPIVQAFEEAEKTIREGRFSDYAACNFRLHETIWKMTGNKKLFSTVTSLFNWSSRASHASDEEYVQLAHEEHRKIVQAILARDEKAAFLSMEAHLKRSMENMLTYLED